MKLILNQLIEAQKQTEANLIRRREETAAAEVQLDGIGSSPITAVYSCGVAQW